MSQGTRLSATQPCINRVSNRLGGRSKYFVRALQPGIGNLILLPILLFGVAVAYRFGSALAPSRSIIDLVRMLLPYGLIVPVRSAGYRIAMASPANLLPERPRIRLAVFGRWRQLDPLTAAPTLPVALSVSSPRCRSANCSPFRCATSSSGSPLRPLTGTRPSGPQQSFK